MIPMEHDSQEFELPLELQFSMRKAEVQAMELTWEQLFAALMNLYHQRLMENHAIRSLLADEQVFIDFDIPTELEMVELAAQGFFDDDDDEDRLQSA
jgi:hypothetical protein